MAITPNPYIPSFIKSTMGNGNGRPLQLTFNQVNDTNIKSTSSFIYDAQGSPLKSTQQLNVDWSNFINHTFFMSAEVKVNLAFDQIINGYPFDSSRAEVEKFFEKLTGYEKWIFDQFPRFKGQLHLSGTQVGEDNDGTSGTWIQVKDFQGALFPELSKTESDTSVLTPKNNSSLTVELQLYVPEESTPGTQVLLQKTSGSSQGFCAYLVTTGSTSYADLRFSIMSGSTQMTTQAPISKGVFTHVAFIFNRELGTHSLSMYANGDIVDISRTKQNKLGDMSIDSSDFYIGTGSAINVGSTTITPTQTFSGSIDELRLFHSARTISQLNQYARKSLFASPELKLYYRFNEPPPPLTANGADSINAIVIDSSGNALHSLINNFFNFVDVDTNGDITSSLLRQNASLDSTSNMIYENPETTLVLFPGYDSLVELNTELLTSASEYDRNNPNIITRQIPEHYLLDGSALEGYEELQGDIGNSYSYNDVGMPGQGKKGGTQMLLSLLYIYAKFFDELKLYVDSFSSLNYVNYDKTDTVPDNMMLTLVKQLGFNLPPLFNDSSIEQYIRAENIDLADNTLSSYSLRYVQNELLRRVLVNMPDVLRSKGTQHAIKSFLRAVGIDPDNSLRIREFGGPTTRQLTYAREIKREPGVMAEFFTGSLVVSPFLSGSRVEPGYPYISGSFVQQNNYPPGGISNSPNDGLFTSGSWTYESIVKWTPTQARILTSATQSLVRLEVTGTNDSEGGVIANLLAVSSSSDPRIMLYIRPCSDYLSPYLYLSLDLPDAGLFDGSRWNVSFGTERNDSISSRVSSSYFLRASTQNNGEITTYSSTSSYFYESADQTGELNVLRTFHSSSNTSGSYISIGQNTTIISGSGSGYAFLNNTTQVPDEARKTDFTGLMSNVRFWSKALSETEWKEHVRNFKSAGVTDPTTNYNFVSNKSGSFEKLRLDSLTKQIDRYADSTSSVGSITFKDFSLNGNHLTGSGFPIETLILRGEIFDYSYLSPNFDEASSTDKIRVRSFQNQELVDSVPWAQVAPVYEVVKSEQPTDDVRFVIEFSLVDALNRDIVTIFSTLDLMNNALGNPELVFSPDYPDLEKLRDVYFNRLTSKLNFKAFFEFFRWFDTSIGTFIEQLVPRKTNFKGTNFIIESHMLERHKIQHMGSEMYLGISDRLNIGSSLVLQQIVGTVKKY